MNQFVAYGATILTPLNLGPYLCSGEGRLHQVKVFESSDTGVPPLLVNQKELGPGHGREITISTDGKFSPSVSGQSWQFEVIGVVRFNWKSGRKNVSFQRLEACTDELLAFWVIHIFLPIYLNLEGVCNLLHACAVEVEDKTILFAGPSFGGKSTLTDYFLKQGHNLVSDDKVAIIRDGDNFFAVPSHPNNRPYRRFEDLGQRVSRFSFCPRPISAIYLLRASEPDADIRITEIHGHEKFTCLLPSHMFNMGTEPETRLQFLGELMQSVCVYQIEIPRDLDRLDEVYQEISGHL